MVLNTENLPIGIDFWSSRETSESIKNDVSFFVLFDHLRYLRCVHETMKKGTHPFQKSTSKPADRKK